MDQLQKDLEDMKCEAQRLAKEAEGKLEPLLPIIEKSEDLLRSLTLQDIAVVKALCSPPEAVNIAIDATLTALGRETGPDQRKALLKDSRFLELLFNFDRDSVNGELLKPYINDPKFEPDYQKRASRLGFVLSSWVTSLHTFSEACKDLKPMREEYSELLKRISITENAIANFENVDVDATSSK
eukprot:TRINITY_DN1274_c0_g2_i1.p1 TRINITY_DN1274_c0_g2~~TRINITY_DN1274_c0_g2_i1.p1  ORF type:complete len:184 (+),score=36.04 TRINITY_DN1274_c0_g2_i1:47-598(+)